LPQVLSDPPSPWPSPPAGGEREKDALHAGDFGGPHLEWLHNFSYRDAVAKLKNGGGVQVRPDRKIVV